VFEVCSSLSLAGFGDLDSMLKALNMSRSDRGVKKEVKKVKEEVKEEVKPSCVLPWCGEVIIGKCSALKLNSGLHTQCMKSCDSVYCDPCRKLVDKNGGIAPYGTVDDRLKYDILEYKDPKGKQTIPYANVMKKLNIDKEEALKEAEKLGWSIPDCHFELKSSKRGRPKKDTSAEDTEPASDSVSSAEVSFLGLPLLLLFSSKWQSGILHPNFSASFKASSLSIFNFFITFAYGIVCFPFGSLYSRISYFSLSSTVPYGAIPPFLSTNFLHGSQ
jgi:hypothetical protein